MHHTEKPHWTDDSVSEFGIFLNEDLALLQAVNTGGELQLERGFLGVCQEQNPRFLGCIGA